MHHVTSITEQPATGTLWVVGYAMFDLPDSPDPLAGDGPGVYLPARAGAFAQSVGGPLPGQHLRPQEAGHHPHPGQRGDRQLAGGDPAAAPGDLRSGD